jgi:hypothetical protein
VAAGLDDDGGGALAVSARPVLPAAAAQPDSSSDATASDTIAWLRFFVALIILSVLS